MRQGKEQYLGQGVIDANFNVNSLIEGDKMKISRAN